MNKSMAKSEKSKKKKLGQFMTPPQLSEKIVNQYIFNKDDKVLEPSFGEGSFLIPLIKKFIKFYKNENCPVSCVLKNNIYGVEYDKEKYDIALDNIKKEFNIDLQSIKTNLFNNDYFLQFFDVNFTHVIGNPPFGGTFDPELEDDLEKKYGKRLNRKIKKETYSFFLIKSIEELKEDGVLEFICSDTFLTINTMSGLRNYLMENNRITINKVSFFSDETDYGMVIIKIEKGISSKNVNCFGKLLSYTNINKTKNLSWRIDNKYVKYFSDKTISDFVTCSSGMTIGNNDLFIRKINKGKIQEPYKFSFYDKKITLTDEISKARLKKISDKKKKDIQELEKKGETKKSLLVKKLESPVSIPIPNKLYMYYNKAENDIIYVEPKWVIYWGENDGEEVYTFKKNGNWYLQGVGGKKFFKKKCLTWALISDRIKVRYLPKDYILDSGSPIAVLKENIEEDFLFFVMGWLLTETCNSILKNVINHTKNIQGKDIERLPFPYWALEEKEKIIKNIKLLIKDKKQNNVINEKLLLENEYLFNFKEKINETL